jgi:hypothetical protein
MPPQRGCTPVDGHKFVAGAAVGLAVISSTALHAAYLAAAAWRGWLVDADRGLKVWHAAGLVTLPAALVAATHDNRFDLERRVQTMSWPATTLVYAALFGPSALCAAKVATSEHGPPAGWARSAVAAAIAAPCAVAAWAGAKMWSLSLDEADFRDDRRRPVRTNVGSASAEDHRGGGTVGSARTRPEAPGGDEGWTPLLDGGGDDGDGSADDAVVVPG